MQKTFLFVAGFLLLFSCNSGQEQQNAAEAPGSVQAHMSLMSSGEPVFINKDSANRMIGSYLNSIPVSQRDSSLASLIINADSLRAYLNDTSLHIVDLKIMFAHTQEYINTGNYGRPAGYKSGALTMVLAGFNDSGNYVFFNGNGVMDHCWPCPTHCPTIGTAQGNYFP